MRVLQCDASSVSFFDLETLLLQMTLVAVFPIFLVRFLRRDWGNRQIRKIWCLIAFFAPVELACESWLYIQICLSRVGDFPNGTIIPNLWPIVRVPLGSTALLFVVFLVKVGLGHRKSWPRRLQLGQLVRLDCVFGHENHRAFQVSIVVQLTKPVTIDFDDAGQRLISRHVWKETVLRHLVIYLDWFVIVIIVIVAESKLLGIHNVVLLQINLRRGVVLLRLQTVRIVGPELPLLRLPLAIIRRRESADRHYRRRGSLGHSPATAASGSVIALPINRLFPMTFVYLYHRLRRR